MQFVSDSELLLNTLMLKPTPQRIATSFVSELSSVPITVCTTPAFSTDASRRSGVIKRLALAHGHKYETVLEGEPFSRWAMATKCV